MESNEKLPKDVHDEIELKSMMNVPINSNIGKVNRRIRRFIYIASLVGVGLLFKSCIGGYIATEPVYVQSPRPPQPSNSHIWIEGDWMWSRQTHTYVQRNGYWEQPRQNRTWVPGYWQNSPRGRYYTAGHWQRNGRKMGHRNR